MNWKEFATALVTGAGMTALWNIGFESFIFSFLGAVSSLVLWRT